MEEKESPHNFESVTELAANQVVTAAEDSLQRQFSEHEVALRKATLSQLTTLNTTIRERSLNSNEKRFLLAVAHGNVRQVSGHCLSF